MRSVFPVSRQRVFEPIIIYRERMFFLKHIKKSFPKRTNAGLRNQSRPAAAAFKIMATTLVTLHVAAYAEGLAAPGVGALEGLLAGVGVAVDSQGAGPGEGLVAGLADVPVLGLREGRGRGRRDVVVVLPRVGSRGRAHGHRDRQRGEGLGQGALVVETRDLGLGGRRGLHGRVVRGHGGLGHVRRGGELRLVRRGLDGNAGDSGGSGGGHVVPVVRLDVAQGRCRLEVVVRGDRELAHRLRRGRVVAFERSVRGHRRRWRECRARHGGGTAVVR